MAFDAGAIEATLTLNRNPFTAGLAAAKAQVDQWKRRNSPIEVDVKVNLRQKDLTALEAQLKKFAARTFKATASVEVNRKRFDVLLKDLQVFNRKRYSTTVDVNTTRATAKVVAFRTLLRSLNDQTVNLRANTRGFGNDASSAFDGGASHFQKMAILVISLLPVIASAFTATVGAVGALAGAFLVAGLGAGALALVSIGAFKSIKEAALAGQAEINKLPPALRDAGNAFKEMNDTQQKLTNSSQKLVGIMLAAWFRAGTAALKTLNPLVEASAKAFTNVAERAKIFFEGTWWREWVGWLSTNMMPIVSRLGSILFSLIEIVGNLTRAFMDLGGTEILDMITQGLAEFALWTDKIGQNKTFQQFMDAAVHSLPIVGALIGELLEFIIKLAIGLEPLGSLIIQIFTKIFEILNSLPIPTIQAIALAIAAVWAAIALGATGPVGIAVGVLVGLSVIFADLATKNDNLKASFNAFVDDLKTRWQPIWDTIVRNFNQYILPAWESLRAAVEDKLIPALQRFGDVFMQEVWPKVQPFVNEITETLVPAVLGFLEALVGIIAWLVDTFGPTVARELGDAITVFQGFFDIVAGALNVFTGIFTLNWTTFTQGIQEITRGFWTIVAGMFGMNLDELKAKMQVWSTEQVFTWQGMWDSIKGGASDFFTWFNNGWIKLWQDSANEAKTWGGVVAGSFQHDFLDVMKGAATGFFDWFTSGWVKLWTDTESEQHTWSGRITGSFQRDFIDVLKNAFTSFASWFVNGWRTMGTSLKNEWDSWAGFLASAFRTLVNNARTGANSVIDELNRLIGAVNNFLSSLGVGGIPTIGRLESGGTLDGGSVPGMAAGGRVGGGFTTNGPMAIVGEGNPRYPEYVIPTDPKYRDRAQGLYSSLGPQLMASGGILSIPGNLAGGAQAAVDGIINSLTSSMGWKWGEIAVAVAHKASSAMVAKIQAGINAVMAAIAAAAATVFGGGGVGVGGGDARAWIIAHESGGNPRAQNPTSSASGLYQFIDGTWRALGGSTAHAKDASVAEQNAIADRYVAQRYGGWEGAKAFWQSHGWYDRGGVLPTGTSIATNNTGHPEAILTQAQLSAFTSPSRQSLTVEDVLALLNSRDDGMGGSGDVYNVMLPEKASVRELADQLDFKRRVVRMGRYSR